MPDTIRVPRTGTLLVTFSSVPPRDGHSHAGRTQEKTHMGKFSMWVIISINNK